MAVKRRRPKLHDPEVMNALGGYWQRVPESGPRWVARSLASREWQLILRCQGREDAVKLAEHYLGAGAVVMTWQGFLDMLWERVASEVCR